MKETTIEPYLPMLERFEEFFREELASRLSVESVDSVMEAAVENFHRISAIIPDVPPTSPWVKNIIGIAYEIGLWQELSARGWSPAELSIVTQKALKSSRCRVSLLKNFGNTRNVVFARLCASHRFRFACFHRGRLAVRLRVAECGRTFDVGMDIARCPVAELCSRIGVECFFPYFCVNDYITHDVLGIRLTRTRTLAHGASCCDFRLTKERGAADGAVVIRPEDLQEFTNNG